MRYALIFAGVAAAYDAYGHDGYGDNKASSSTPAVKYTSSAPAYGGYGDDYKTSSAPAPSKSSASSKIGYTTIHPGYGKEPVTVTSQYQAYPTCGAAGSDGKSCNKWNEDKYVSTVIGDCDSKKVTVTHTDKPITVYHTKTTVTHYPTAPAGGKDGHAYPTGSYGYDDKKNVTKPWYELYEKVHEVKYKDLGAHALPGYGGSGLCKSCDDEQPYKVKEYKDGKWSEYETTAVYKAPTPETKTYEKPGVYTEPAKDVTVTYTITKPSEATTTAKAGVPVTYGGYTTDFKETGVKTCAYGAYETGKDKDGKDVTSTVVKTVTVTVSTTGKYEVAKPTTTVYDHDTEVAYPTVTVYKPGVYHKDAQTVTITKSGDYASCEYKQTKTYPAEPEKTPVHDNEYPHYGDKSSSKPAVETKTYDEYKHDYPVTTSAHNYHEYPVSSSTPVYDTKKSSSTPCASSSSKPSVETKTKSEGYPVSTPVYDDKYPVSTPVYDDKYPVSTPVYDDKYPVSTPVYDDKYPVSTPVHDDKYPVSTPVYDDKYPVSTPVHDDKYPVSTPVYDDKYPVSTPVHDDKYPVSTPVHDDEYPHYPTTTLVAHYGASSSTPCPTSTKPVDGHKSSSIAYPEYPAASSSAPVYDNAYPAAPSKTPAAYPEEPKDNSYESGKGYGYARRA